MCSWKIRAYFISLFNEMEIDEQEMQERPPSSSLILSKTCQGEDIPRRVLDFVVLSLIRHVFQPPQAVEALCVSCTGLFVFLIFILVITMLPVESVDSRDWLLKAKSL